MRILFLIIALATLTAETFAAKYYVKYGKLIDGVVVGEGDNNADGLSIATAWKHCPGDPEATGNPASTTLSPGDTVAFDPVDSVYGGRIYILVSGTSDTNRITYDGGDTAWGGGSEMADMSSTNRLSNVFAALDSSGSNSQYRQYVTIKNFNAYEIGGIRDDDPAWLGTARIAGRSGSFISFNKGSTGIRVDNITSRKVGTWQNRYPLGGANTAILGIGVNLNNATDVIVANSIFYESGQTGVKIETNTDAGNVTDGVTITNCWFARNHWNIDMPFGSSNGRARNITIINCKIGDSGLFDSGAWLGHPAYDNPHTNGLMVRRGQGVVNNLIESMQFVGCVFYSDNFPESKGGTGSIFLSQIPCRILIRNCLFLGDKKANGHVTFYGDQIDGTGGGKIEIFVVNNTFYRGSRSVNMGMGDTMDTNDTLSVHGFNNLLINQNASANDHLSTLCRRTNTSGGIYELEWDYNVWWRPFTVSRTVALFNGAYQTHEQIKARGFDTHGWLTTNSVNPGVVDSLTSTPRSLADWRLTADSPMKLAGLDFGATNWNGMPLKGTDRFGRSPDVGGINIGAYHGDINTAIVSTPSTHDADIPPDGNLRTYPYGDPDGNPGSGSVPPDPTGLTAELFSPTQGLLNWVDVDGEDGYKIERKTGAGGAYGQIGTTAAGVTTYMDSTAVTESTTYIYRVRAYNATGNSGYSDEASITTPGGSTPPPDPVVAPPGKHAKDKRR
jgi:hypothetical protein